MDLEIERLARWRDADREVRNDTWSVSKFYVDKEFDFFAKVNSFIVFIIGLVASQFVSITENLYAKKLFYVLAIQVLTGLFIGFLSLRFGQYMSYRDSIIHHKMNELLYRTNGYEKAHRDLMVEHKKNSLYRKIYNYFENVFVLMYGVVFFFSIYFLLKVVN